MMKQVKVSYIQHWDGWIDLTDEQYKSLKDSDDVFFTDYSNGIVLMDFHNNVELASFRWTDEDKSNRNHYDYDTPYGVEWKLIEENV